MQQRTRASGHRELARIHDGQIGAVAQNDHVVQVDRGICEAATHHVRIRVGRGLRVGAGHRQRLAQLSESSGKRLTRSVREHPAGTTADENILPLGEQLHIDCGLAHVRHQTRSNRRTELTRRLAGVADHARERHGSLPQSVEGHRQDAQFGMIVDGHCHFIARMKDGIRSESRLGQR